MPPGLRRADRPSGNALCIEWEKAVGIFATMSDRTRGMRRCLQIARNGSGLVAPNPMVGAVLAQGDRILAEGWHQELGGPHAEVECFRAFGDGAIPKDATLYVNLEPCSHHGRTPPCVDLLIDRGVKRLVVGTMDPDPRVRGRGLARARANHIEVIEGVLQDECRWLNRRFLLDIERERPYVILKWAVSADGFLDAGGTPVRISSPATDVLVHRWRSQEQAIMIGSRTAVNDDPSLTVRLVAGKDPLRVLLDRRNRVPSKAVLFTDGKPTLVFNESQRSDIEVQQRTLGMDDEPIITMLTELHGRNIRSVLVEGGAELLGHFLRTGLWDEARVITGSIDLEQGTRAPMMSGSPAHTTRNGTDRMDVFLNGIKPAGEWDW